MRCAHDARRDVDEAIRCRPQPPLDPGDCDVGLRSGGDGRLLRPPGIDVVTLTTPLLRTVSIAYRRTAFRRPALHLVIEAVRASAAELGLGTESALP